MLRIQVRLLGELREILGEEMIEINLLDGAKIIDALNILMDRCKRLKNYLIDSSIGHLRPEVLIFINGQESKQDLNIKMKDGDMITIALMIMGG